MKITKGLLKEIIEEEIRGFLNENNVLFHTTKTNPEAAKIGQSIFENLVNTIEESAQFEFLSGGSTGERPDIGEWDTTRKKFKKDDVNPDGTKSRLVVEVQISHANLPAD